jgi:CRISPR-associated protein (TIGR03985 family)
MRPQFENLPTVQFLHLLAQGNNLKQQLPKAVRLWVILRSLYGIDTDEVKLGLGENFTYNQWRDEFFSAKNSHTRDKVPPLHDPECNCAKSLKYWLFDSSLCIAEDEWKKSFLPIYKIQADALEMLLYSGKINQPKETTKNPNKKGTRSKPTPPESGYQEIPKYRLFGVTGKNLQYDFESLIKLGWLEAKTTKSGIIIEHEYLKVQSFPDINISHDNSTETEKIITSCDFTEIYDTYREPINGTQRFFMHVDYVVSPEAIDRIGDFKEQLKSIWEKTTVPPISIVYDSASLGKEGQRLIYPVCLYYFQRAPYLCAFGQRPKNKKDIGWYNYRLDRIQTITELDWNNAEIPVEVRQQWENKSISPEYIQGEMAEAWGFDFYQDSRVMLLRFDQEFSENYIEDSFRHETFKQIKSQTDFQELSREYSTIPEAKELLEKIKSNFPNDDSAYYTAKYRVGDNNVIMRLRAWGPNVEVLLPQELRDRVKEDSEKTWQLYQNTPQGESRPNFMG